MSHMALEKHKDFFHKHHKRIQHKTETAWQWAARHIQTLFWVGLSLGVVLVGLFIIWIATLQVPTLDTFSDRKISSSTKIYDRTGEIVLYNVHENVKRTVVPGDQISPLVKNAVIAIEDKDFYKHHGIQPRAIVRAILSQIIPNFSTNSQGGSTITQQLVKNTLLTQQKSISRKVKEWVLAIKLERVLTKEQILTAYLNEAPYGGSIYGIEQASQDFFKKNALDLTLAESAYLAAIPNAPSYYSPYGKNRPNLNARKNLVLKNMLAQGYITQEEHDLARAEEVVFRSQQEINGKALHFTEYIRSYLEKKYGADMVLNGGLQVKTTLDWEMQEFAEKTILENALKNEKEYNASNSALVAIDPKTGQVLTMVGSRNYSDELIDGMFNVATAGRQPGSSFKPIVYARSFEKGFEPETVVFDVPTQFGTGASCGPNNFSTTPPCYAPKNYDNAWLGPINLRNALGQSRNIPAVKMLWMIGLNDALATGKKLGITTLDRNADRYGLTLVLGGGEVSLLDMTSVYSVFANDGVRNETTAILEVRDASGVILEEFSPNPQGVMDPHATRKLSSVLSDNAARSPLFGPNSFFYFGARPVAGKTGTTDNNRDAWVFGYTPSLAVGVWTGNNDNAPMKKGSSISGPAWRAFMDFALTKVPYNNPGARESFPEPEQDPAYNTKAPVLRGAWAGGESFWVDTVSGKLATELTPPETRKEYVIPEPHSILYWVNPSNPRGPRPTNPQDNSQFESWEAGVKRWIASHPGIIPPYPKKPTGFDDVHTIQNQPQVIIQNPIVGGEINSNDQVQVITKITLPSSGKIQEIDYYLGENYLGSNTTPSFTFIPRDTTLLTGQTTLRVVVTDTLYNKGEATIDIVLR